MATQEAVAAALQVLEVMLQAPHKQVVEETVLQQKFQAHQLREQVEAVAQVAAAVLIREDLEAQVPRDTMSKKQV